MGVRALRAKIKCDRSVLDHLWRTHVAYNEHVRSLLLKLFAMRRGQLGVNAAHKKACADWMNFVLSRPAKDAVYLLNAISIENWQPRTAMAMVSKKMPKDPAEKKEAEKKNAALIKTIEGLAHSSAQGKVAYNKTDERDGLPDSLFQPLTRDALACMSSHEELLNLWKSRHAAWLVEKEKWELDPENALYLAVRSEFEKFEAMAGGKAGKRRGRWHLYMDWLSKTPTLAAWRGGDAVVHPIPTAAQSRIAKAKPWKQGRVAAEEFWKANPELAALDKLHGVYERRFVRSRKRKRNPDGFDHRPTFTQPHPIVHPRWVMFNAPQTAPVGYQNLVLPSHPNATGFVELRLLTGEKSGDKHPNAFIRVELLADERLARFRSVPVKRVVRRGSGSGREVDGVGYVFWDDHLRKNRPAEISGLKLIFENIRINGDGSLRSATPFLVFTCTIEDEPITDLAKNIVWSDTGETTRSGKTRKTRSVPAGLIACAVDLGVRNIGFATLAQFGVSPEEQTHRDIRVIRSLNVPTEEGLSLAELALHKRRIRFLRRLRGKPVKGELSHKNLQRHIVNMSSDRFKKFARAIVNFALNVEGRTNRCDNIFPRADVIILENLAGLIPDAERARGVNRSLADWNRGQLVQRVVEVAADAGFKGRVFEVSPIGTSQCCSRCGALGRRYSVVRDEPAGKPSIRFGDVEKLFACEKCGYRANADHNASVNLHHVFSSGYESMAAWRSLENSERKRRIAVLQDELLVPLQREHGLAVDTPF